ncbi:hypothetical protein SAMN02990966_02667 [Rhodospirillales bacterium URHD0017]|nr:hypothetical protein SAMN02990966_02667 [Rhodospirillales bacterium URHD0017]
MNSDYKLVTSPRSKKQAWKYWGSVVAVNLGAAVVAALCFGVWQRFHLPQATASVPGKGGAFYELADDVGYIPRANARMTRAAVEERRTNDDVVYTTGADHFRVVPGTAEEADACVLLFGDSFTFGVGVNDEETFAAQIVKESGRRVAAQNFAVSGWGPHQFLAGLQSGRFQRAVRCRPTDAVFLMIPSLIWRASGVTNAWDTTGPRYRLGVAGRPVRDGTFGDPDPYNWRRWIGLDPVSKSEASSLAAAVVVEAMSELKRLYPGIRTHFISYRVGPWSDSNFSAEELAAFEYNLGQKGITALPLEAIIPRYRFAQLDYVLDPTDLHPNARAHHLIAEFFLREIKPDQQETKGHSK